MSVSDVALSAGAHKDNRRAATMIAYSSTDRTVDLTSFGPAGRPETVSHFFHLATIFWLIP